MFLEAPLEVPGGSWRLREAPLEDPGGSRRLWEGPGGHGDQKGMFCIVKTTRFAILTEKVLTLRGVFNDCHQQIVVLLEVCIKRSNFTICF